MFFIFVVVLYFKLHQTPGLSLLGTCSTAYKAHGAEKHLSVLHLLALAQVLD